MKLILILLLGTIAIASAQHRSKEEMDKLISLNAFKIKSAGITITDLSKNNFETTLFAIGSIQTIPDRHTVISSRIAGRVVSKPPIVGDYIKTGQTVLQVESRQPGSPPPVIPMTSNGSGIVFQSHVNLGEPVEPSEELMDIVDISEVWAVANIPESKASKVKIGQTARIRISALGSESFTGTLIKFGTEANQSNGTIQAIFLLKNPEFRIRPNMRTEFNIVTSMRENVLSIPKSAILGDKLNRHLYRKDWELDHTFEKVDVLTGEENDTHVEVFPSENGLLPTDEIVISGGYFLVHAKQDKGSLKAALDAAHGHEHNEDGSEMSAAEKAAKEAATNGSADGGGKNAHLVMPLIISNGIFLLILAFTIFKKKDVA